MQITEAQKAKLVSMLGAMKDNEELDFSMSNHDFRDILFSYLENGGCTETSQTEGLEISMSRKEMHLLSDLPIGVYQELASKLEEYGPSCDPGECDECDEGDGKELVKKAANLLRQAPDEVKEGWLEGFIEVFRDDGEEVPPLNELVYAWEENQFDSLGYDFAVKEVKETIAWIEKDIWKFNVTKAELFIDIEELQGQLKQANNQIEEWESRAEKILHIVRWGEEEQK